MKLKNRDIGDFFKSDYCDYASYDNIRKIASLVDGQKNSSRKILWFTQQKNQKNEIKVSQLDSKVSEYTEYLHGSLANVVVNLAQDYTGANNINLMFPEGNFGTRMVPEASAARYIYTYGTDEFFKIFSKEDDEILEHQYFEGHKIEPKFMLPNIPMLLVNGAEGITPGFSQKILPRDPKAITKYLKYRLETPQDGTQRPLKPFRAIPYYKGFKGTVTQTEDGYPNKWTITGVFSRKSNRVQVTELPVGTSLKAYIKILDRLEDDRKIISYKDSSNKSFLFEIQFNRKYLDSLSDNQLITLLKLQKKTSEIYTVMDHNNVIQQMENVGDIMEAYIKVKLEYLQKRKDHQIKTISSDIRFMISKYVFIKSIVDENLVISNRKTEDIEKDLMKLPKVIQKDDSWDYLLGMSIRSLTKERMDKLLAQIKEAKAELDTLKTSTVENLWLADLT
jgi:DNA topoisomerase-2